MSTPHGINCDKVPKCAARKCDTSPITRCCDWYDSKKESTQTRCRIVNIVNDHAKTSTRWEYYCKGLTQETDNPIFRPNFDAANMLSKDTTLINSHFPYLAHQAEVSKTVASLVSLLSPMILGMLTYSQSCSSQGPMQRLTIDSTSTTTRKNPVTSAEPLAIPANTDRHEGSKDIQGREKSA